MMYLCYSVNSMLCTLIQWVKILRTLNALSFLPSSKYNEVEKEQLFFSLLKKKLEVLTV